MKLANRRNGIAGYALGMVMVFTAVGMIVLTGAMNWTSQTAYLTDRNNQYTTTLYAAEAATEKVLTRILQDYKAGGESTVYPNLSTYRTLVPTTNENGLWGNFRFANAQGTDNQTYVERVVTASTPVPLESQYAGLSGFASTYRIISNARLLNTSYRLTNAVQQDVQVATIPIFQFAIFYTMDLEINTQTTMEIRGPTHGNGTIYMSPSAPVTFLSDVTSVGRIVRTRKPGDPAYSATLNTTTVNFNGRRDTNRNTLVLPIGTNNTSAAVHQVIETPSAAESPTSELGKQRYYNKAELQMVIKDSSATIVALNRITGVSNTIAWNLVTNFVRTNATFRDQREAKTVIATEIDVGKFRAWAATNTTISNVLGAATPPNIIYVDDQRTASSSILPAVRLTNGTILPSRGLTVATPNPLYVMGNYNVTNSSHLNTTNTTTSKPASLVSDALTVLSGAWSDAKSSSNYTARVATNTTVNAAILTGIVATTNTPARYSGGVHNLGRFLEDWNAVSGTTITYNGSMVVMFDSQKAVGAFQQPGAYYDPPTREFYFDQNFYDIAKQPPGTPELRAIIRGKWLNPPVNNVTWTQTQY